MARISAGPRGTGGNNTSTGTRTGACESAAGITTPNAGGASSVMTAGNASGVNDGSCALLLANETHAAKNGLTPKARVVGMATVGVAPRIMGIGPLPATQKVLVQTGLTIAQMDVIELNEAFASQSLAVIRELGLNPDIVNVNGGAIALGHPLGCTGAKLSVQLFDEMRLRKSKYGIVSMCVGTGQGSAGIYELL